jgi:acetyltransferase-like isoleucine patch superfamily enzyme
MSTSLSTDSSYRTTQQLGKSPLRLAMAALRHPGRAFTFGSAILKGHAYRVWCRLRGRRFSAGPGLAIYGRLSVRGPGEVTLGRNAAVYGRVNLWTYAPEARIRIADNVIFGGTRISSVKEITVGRDCILADSAIRDTDFHSVRADRRMPGAPVRVAPVHIADNVWVAASAILLPGTSIGENSVVGAGAVCMRGFPADKVILGNPAKVAMPLPSVGGAAAVMGGALPVEDETERSAAV